MTTEAKSIAHGGAHNSFLGFVKSEVQLRVEGRVVSKMVYRRRYDVMNHCHDGSNGFDSAGSAKQVAGHGFGGADV